MQYHILLGLAAFLLTAEFSLQKKYQITEGNGANAVLKFNACYGLFTALAFFCLNGFRVDFSVFSVWMAFSFSFCCVMYLLLGFRIMAKGNMALYSLFLMIGGMIVPYVFGVLCLNEPLTLLRIIGLLLMFAAMVLTGNTKWNGARTTLLLCVAVFFLNGTCSVIAKCHSIDTTHGAVGDLQYVMFSGVGRLLFSSVALCFCKRKAEKSAHPHRPLWVLSGFSAIVGGISFALQLVGAAHLPATVTYPLISGGSIVFSTLAGMLVFKETVTAKQWIGVFLCLTGTCFFL